MVCASPYCFCGFRDTSKETIALCGTRCVIIDIQVPSFTRVNSRRLHSQNYGEVSSKCYALTDLSTRTH